MRLLGSDSLASLLGSILTVAWFTTWLFVPVSAVLPLLEQTSFYFPAQITHGLVVETEGPGGTWEIQTAEARVTTPPGGTWIPSLVAVPFLVLIALVLGQLRAIFLSLRDGSPFVAANARRLRRIGLGVLAYEALRVVVTITVIGPALKSLRPVTDGVRIQVDGWPDFGTLFLGFAVLVLAEVFRRGTVMQDEQAFTV